MDAQLIQTIIVPLSVTFLFSLVHFFFESYIHHLRRFDVQFISFSSGLFVAYIFLSMFPEVHQGVQFMGNNIFFIMFWGFVLFHIAEKYVFQHTLSKKNLIRRLTHVRTAGFFVNHLVLGIAVVFFFKYNTSLVAYVGLVPIFFHLMSSSLVIEHLHQKVRESVFTKILSSGSLFFGAVIMVLLNLPINIFLGLFAFITGILLYIIIRDTMPKYQEGKPIHFVLGIIVYLFLIALTLVV